MIHFISRYFHDLHINREYYLSRAERRKAWLLACGILVCIAIVLFLWLKN
jgi:hypothetical protein